MFDAARSSTQRRAVDLVTNSRVWEGVGRAVGMLLQAAGGAFHHGLVSIGTSYLILAIGVSSVLVLTVVSEAGAFAIGPGPARRTVRRLERRIGFIVLVGALVVFVARLLGH